MPDINIAPSGQGYFGYLGEVSVPLFFQTFKAGGSNISDVTFSVDLDQSPNNASFIVQIAQVNADGSIGTIVYTSATQIVTYTPGESLNYGGGPFQDITLSGINVEVTSGSSYVLLFRQQADGDGDDALTFKWSQNDAYTDGFFGYSQSANPSGSLTLDSVGGDLAISIKFSDTAPVATLSIDDVSQAEGSTGGTTAFTFTVTRSGSSAGTASVNYQGVAGTADTSDVAANQAFSGTVNFADGETSKIITIQVNADYAIEADETFTINLSNPVNATISDGTGVGTIVNDDQAGLITIGNPTVVEGNDGTTQLVYSVTRSGGTGNISFTLSTDNTGTATAGSDYVAATQDYVLTGGQTGALANFVVTVNGDFNVEANETVVVSGSNSSNAGLMFTGGTGTIQNDDAFGNLSISNSQLVEGDNGTSQMVFTLTRTDGSAPLSVTASTQDLPGGATAGTDYVANTQTINFAAGETTKTFSVTINGDTINESNENFQVNLSNATAGTTIVQGGGIGTGTATGTILNDDATFTISGASVVEGNTPVSVVQVQVSRDPANSQFATTLYTQAVAGTATAGSDYDGGTTTVNFAAGQSTAFVSIAIVGDQVIEPNETFTVNLYSNAGRTNLLSSSTVTIVNDDGSSVTNAFGPGNDVLYATSAGGETLAGGNGDDQYLVNSIDDVIIEGPNAGYDTVFTASSYTLNGGSFVESLSTQTHSDTTNINLIGNFHDQLIIGNFGDNVLNGNGGVDTLIGLQGNDTYVVGDAAAQIIENAGEGYDVAYARVSYTLGAGVEVEALSTQTVAETAAIDLTGNEFSQLVIGNMGANVLNGGGGADTLIGLGGADTFAFTTALGANNVDTIQDFEAGVDQISLSSSIFGNLATGELSATAFTVGTQATTADQRIVYDQATGKLFYDADGSGSGEAVLFAQVAPGTIITPADMVVTP
ncbi:Calx-beta domain-containing protein [Altererythrobacter sp. TH136]|uniref:beta strand repeat-containing protein n=1 Tax=Altererythrobacter sp. TH136 TaxID=2067415 RepID=UPI00116360EE|nr:Calx-beta domain-containing protein [Altererythrobacter sp. TH136]QDM41002.1 hypothetical protein C0V74_08150 [Altererythrobacter sp. TH136]